MKIEEFRNSFYQYLFDVTSPLSTVDFDVFVIFMPRIKKFKKGMEKLYNLYTLYTNPNEYINAKYGFYIAKDSKISFELQNRLMGFLDGLILDINSLTIYCYLFPKYTLEYDLMSCKEDEAEPLIDCFIFSYVFWTIFKKCEDKGYSIKDNNDDFYKYYTANCAYIDVELNKRDDFIYRFGLFDTTKDLWLFKNYFLKLLDDLFRANIINQTIFEHLCNYAFSLDNFYCFAPSNYKFKAILKG